MKHTIQTTGTTIATLRFEGGYEEVFIRMPAEHFVLIQQDGYLIDIPASDFRSFLKALSEWADEAGIPA